MGCNYASPTDLLEWARDTDNNRHREVRAKVVQWAAINAKDIRVKRLCCSLGKEIDRIYQTGIREGSISTDEFDLACRFTKILLYVIRQEFGDETANKIEECL